MCSYDADHTAGLPDPALLASLGCGNPTAVAELREGEVVLDLGSGGGIDALLSARRVGSAGTAYGLDMTEEMLALARDNAAKAEATNIEFLRGQIEDVPLPANSVDVIISNCIVNLFPDKPAVLRETHRVLVPGGRIGISDSAMSPSWATPTNSPSASCTRGDNGRSLLVTACAADTFPFTVVLLRSRGSGRSGRTAVLKFYGLRDNLPGRCATRTARPPRQRPVAGAGWCHRNRTRPDRSPPR